jgi:hypothetical protein
LQQLGQQLPTLPTNLKMIYKKSIHNNIGPRSSSSDILGALASIVALFSEVFILVDALDELTDLARYEFLNQILHFQVHLFATSRIIPDIAQCFEAAIVLTIRPSDRDIRTLIYDNPNGRMRQAIQKSPELEEQIKESVVQRADGI